MAEHRVLARYRCTVAVEMKRGGDLIGQTAFKQGEIYDYVGKERDDYLLINELGLAHAMDLRFMKTHFTRLEANDE